MDEGKQVFKGISGVMKDLGAIGKTQRNSQQGWIFRGIDDVYNAVNPLMGKYGIFTVPEVLEQSKIEKQTSRGGTLYFCTVKVKYTIFASDGSYIESIIVGEAMDSGDKSVSKALSIAHKYLYFQLFSIPVQETKSIDPDHTALRKDEQIKPTDYLKRQPAQQPLRQQAPQRYPTLQSKQEQQKPNTQQQPQRYCR